MCSQLLPQWVLRTTLCFSSLCKRCSSFSGYTASSRNLHLCIRLLWLRLSCSKAASAHLHEEHDDRMQSGLRVQTRQLAHVPPLHHTVSLSSARCCSNITAAGPRHTFHSLCSWLSSGT